MTVIIPIRAGKQRYEKLKIKPCQFPDCDNYFKGTGFSKYCPEHRKREYRKIIDKLHRKPVITENPNQFYKHDHASVLMITFSCALCNILFEVKIYPNIFIYPKYCDEHRNEHKRILWQKKNSNLIVPPAPIIDAIENIPIDQLPDMKNPELIEELNNTFLDYDEDVELIPEELIEPPAPKKRGKHG